MIVGGDIMDNFERVKKIILNQLDIDESIITLDAKFIEDLGADSLDVAEMVMAFEDEFNVEIDEEEIENMRTVSQVAHYFENK